ncbi:hypothetical protein [Streptomyces griseus]|uniref:hypothetical protein n=1 Tax=Streptomyces griseus TaxID=1911 RepID=UPI0008404A6E|nr:hypothetical protein [Streptomyces griseus]
MHVGSRTALRGSGQTWTVTGRIELPGELDASALCADAGAALGAWKAAAERVETVVPPHPDDVRWLARGPAGAEASTA